MRFSCCLFLPFACVYLASADPCDSAPCKNDGTCESSGSSFTCTCAAGYEGTLCETNINECLDNDVDVCENGGTCTDGVGSFECDCPFGYGGARCDIVANFTLQQWKGSACEGPPWRAFRLQMGLCVDTGLPDGNIGSKDQWFGKLHLGDDGKYIVDLCWGIMEDKEEQCSCDNHFTAIPKLGKNSLGPPTPGVYDSDSCHKLKRITSSRLVNSSGINADHDDENKRNVDWAVPSGAWRGAANLPLLLAALSAILVQL